MSRVHLYRNLWYQHMLAQVTRKRTTNFYSFFERNFMDFNE